MPGTILHIGLHKTATTTLQHQLFPQTPGLNLFVTLQQPMRDFMQMVTRQDPAYFDPEAAREGVPDRGLPLGERLQIMKGDLHHPFDGGERRNLLEEREPTQIQAQLGHLRLRQGLHTGHLGEVFQVEAQAHRTHPSEPL